MTSFRRILGTALIAFGGALLFSGFYRAGFGVLPSLALSTLLAAAMGAVGAWITKEPKK